MAIVYYLVYIYNIYIHIYIYTYIKKTKYKQCHGISVENYATFCSNAGKAENMYELELERS